MGQRDDVFMTHIGTRTYKNQPWIFSPALFPFAMLLTEKEYGECPGHNREGVSVMPRGQK